MTKTAIVTLGRLPKGLDLVRALASSGWRVVVAEPFGWHLCRLSRHVARSVAVTAPNTDRAAYHRDLLKIVSEEAATLIVPVSEEIIHLTAIEPLLPPGVRLLAMPHGDILEAHDKERFVARAAAMGLTVPATARLGTSGAEELAVKTDTIIKPIATCSGQGLSFMARGERLPAPDPGRPSIVQQRLTGAHRSTFSFAHKGRVIGTVVYRGVVFSGTVSCTFERLGGQRDIEDWITRFVAETGWSGMISFDFIDDEAGVPHAIECNPRATSGIHFVEEASLAEAMLSPETCTTLRFKQERLMQQFFPALTEVWGATFRREKPLQKWRTFLRAKDVNFRWSDPLPLWLQSFAAYGIIKRSVLNGESFGEASTFDIAWFGEGNADEPVVPQFVRTP